MPIVITQKGDFKKTFKLLFKLRNREFFRKLEQYGQIGVEALSQATPKRTGKTAESWTYEIHYTDSSVEIVWINTNENKGRNIAVLIQYGHGTRNGGYVQGIDYINPAMASVFDDIAEKVWQEVIS